MMQIDTDGVQKTGDGRQDTGNIRVNLCSSAVSFFAVPRLDLAPMLTYHTVFGDSSLRSE